MSETQEERAKARESLNSGSGREFLFSFSLLVDQGERTESRSRVTAAAPSQFLSCRMAAPQPQFVARPASSPHAPVASVGCGGGLLRHQHAPRWHESALGTAALVLPPPLRLLKARGFQIHFYPTTI